MKVTQMSVPEAAAPSSREEPSRFAAEMLKAAELSGLQRVDRLLLGLLIADLGIGGFLGRWGWLGLLPILAGTTRFCPVYALRYLVATLMRRSA